VAGGDQGCDPHESGHGPLRANQTIILDIFSARHEDRLLGRHYPNGRARTGDRKVKDIFATVAKAQDIAFGKLRNGVNGRDVHQAICDLFSQRGFRTGRKKGRMQGFFHGTGHGLDWTFTNHRESARWTRS